MCEPMTILAVGGTLLTAYGQIKQGNDANAIAEHNAALGRMKGDEALREGVAASDQQAARVRQIRGQQIATMATNGIDPTTGTAAKVLDQTTQYGTLDTEQIRANALKQAWGYETQSQSDLMQGQAAKSSGGLQGFGTILAGGARAYGLYQSAQTPKAQGIR